MAAKDVLEQMQKLQKDLEEAGRSKQQWSDQDKVQLVQTSHLLTQTMLKYIGGDTGNSISKELMTSFQKLVPGQENAVQLGTNQAEKPAQKAVPESTTYEPTVQDQINQANKQLAKDQGRGR